MMKSLFDYLDLDRRWPNIDSSIHKRCCKLQDSNYGEFVKKGNEEMSNSNYTYGMPSADKVRFDKYCEQDIASISKMAQKKDPYLIPGIAKVIYNPQATIILWSDKTKTVVKCCENDIYDPEKGFAMAVIKKLCGNDSALFHRLFKTWVLESKDTPEESIPPINTSVDLADALNDMIRRIFSVGGSDGN